MMGNWASNAEIDIVTWSELWWLLVHKGVLCSSRSSWGGIALIMPQVVCIIQMPDPCHSAPGGFFCIQEDWMQCSATKEHDFSPSSILQNPLTTTSSPPFNTINRLPPRTFIWWRFKFSFWVISTVVVNGFQRTFLAPNSVWHSTNCTHAKGKANKIKFVRRTWIILRSVDS